MAPKNWRFVFPGLCLLAACGGDPEEQDVTQQPPGMQGVASEAGAAAASTEAGAASGTDAGVAIVTGQPDAGQPTQQGTEAGQPAQSTDAGLGSDTGSVSALPFDYKMQAVALTADLVIPKGKIVRVGPGTTFTGKSANVKIDVQGELQVEGSAASPATFLGSGADSSWQGIQVSSGGKLTISQAKISGAKYGIHTLPGSSFSIDRVVFDTSFKSAVLESNGTVSNSTFKAIFLLPAITNEVSIDDPNGSLTIMNASPTVTNSRFEGSGGLNDMIRVGGMASPTFDHIYVTNSHCGFHINGAMNNSPKITNSIFEKLSYGIMAYASAPIVEDSVFKNNGSDVGMCVDATAANAGKLRNNSYEGGALRLDASCDMIGTKDSAPATTANPAAGPSGL
jgi:hypothetical protein